MGPFIFLDNKDRQLLMDVARLSIAHGLESGEPLRIDPRDYSPVLQGVRATFVTLHHGGELRGCLGMIEAIDPLIVDVSNNAFGSAFRDHRFSPLASDELKALEISISILSPLETVPFSSEEDLLKVIRPGVDGLILRSGSRAGTFLPAVWEMLPDPKGFLDHLKQKAGLPARFNLKGAVVERFTVEPVS